MFDLKRYVFLIYCAGVATLVAFQYLLPVPAALTLDTVPPTVESELSEVVSSVYAPDGNRRYRTESTRVRLYHDGVLGLEPVAMQYYSDGQHTMFLRSESGTVLRKSKRINLNGAVELVRPAAARRGHETLNTRDVEVRTEDWIAVTGERVVLERGRQVMRGRGMVADLKKGEFNLLHEIEASYVP